MSLDYYDKVADEWADVDRAEIDAQRSDHAAEMFAEHEAAMRQAIDALVAGGLPRVHGMFLTETEGLVCGCVDAGTVTQWATYFGVAATVKVTVVPDGRRIYQLLEAVGVIGETRVTIRHASQTRVIGGPDVTVVRS